MARGRRRVRRRRGRGRPLKKMFSGGLVRGSMHPRTTSGSPWNNYVLTTTFTVATKGLSCIDTLAVRSALRTEIGVGASQAIDLRVLRMDVWTPPAFAGSDKNAIVFAPDDWTDKVKCDNRAPLNWYEAWGTAVQPANIHYVWPKSIATQVIPNSVDPALATFDTATDGMTYLIKVHLQWRPQTPDLRPVKSGVLHPIRSKSDDDYVSPYFAADFVHVEEHSDME